MKDLFTVALFWSTVRLATPLILAALGGLYSERSGVINIALEGMMLAGAFTAAGGTVFTHNPWVGLLAALLARGLVALLHAGGTIKYSAHPGASAAAIDKP